ncbi:MAG: HIT domain-containing protein [Thermocladium sp.]|jgi:ATP adenylyltransferase
MDKVMSDWGGFDVLFSPWRYDYIKSAVRNELGCFICDYARDNNDDDNLVVFRGRKCLILMNKYPYNRGHIMIAPYRHVASLEDLSDEELKECSRLLLAAITAESSILAPDDFNIGINVGRVAGAGLEEHMHIHVIPRWIGDSSNVPSTYGFDAVLNDMREIMLKLRSRIGELISHDSDGQEIHTA